MLQRLKDWWGRIYFYGIAITEIPSRLLAMRIAVVSFMLLAVGIIMVYSSSFVQAMEQFHDPYYFLKRELFFAALAVSAFIFGM